jgi:hypothetical protein
VHPSGEGYAHGEGGIVSELGKAAYEHAMDSMAIYVAKSNAEWMEKVLALVKSGELESEDVVELLREYAEASRKMILDWEARRLANAVELDLAGMPPPSDVPTPGETS